MTNFTANTEPFVADLHEAARKIRRIDWTKQSDWSTNSMRHAIDWEARLWDLTSKLAVKMADRCQEGLMTPEEFGKLSHSMAVWAVSAAFEAQRTKPPSDAEIQKLLKEFQK